MPIDVSMETSKQFQVDLMETGPSENMEIPQPAASPGPSVPEKRLYKSRSVLLASTGKNFWGWDHITLAAFCSAWCSMAWAVLVLKVRGRISMYVLKAIFKRGKRKEGQSMCML